MSTLSQLIQLCKCGVTVEVNEHRNYYESAENYLSRWNDEDIVPEMRRRMIASNTIAQVQFYPHTAVGFYVLFGIDVDAVLTEALELAEEIAS
ncbi:hypothetical protein E3O44_12590 [Cryobacterium algoricola]|uniref:Uncharacterized protein n=1 Tax=Cryobacterium algoricola TaxID=1259183 RepID=A0ABY2IE09_9MICO|nr:hypothetical protein [Cryobacterium algoricola]TFB85833.1 hypothetical protein E3O44_12590 [Cryobacterium algoricola]